MADFLNTAFAGYDRIILAVLHFFGKYLGFILTPLAKLITLLGEKGLIFYLLALVLACFSKKRKTAVCLFGAVCCGALITNIILKDAVARLRPFETLDLYRQWWETVGASAEDGFSFPSGHVTAAAAGMTALFCAEGKKYLKPGIIWVLLMATVRNYLMVHYPSDVLFAAIIGIASGFIAWEITKLIFAFLEKHDDNRLCALALDFDVPFPRISLPDNMAKAEKLMDILSGQDKPVRKAEKYEEDVEDDVPAEPVKPTRPERRAAAKTSSKSLLEQLGVKRKKGKHEL